MRLAPRPFPGRIVLALTLLVAAMAAGCDIVTPPSPTPAETEEPVVIVPPSGADVVSCIDVELGECRHLAEALLGRLPAGEGNPFLIQVHLFACDPVPEGCPKSLSVRAGQILVEYPNGGPRLSFEAVGPPGTPTFNAQQMIETDPIQPGSPPIEDQVGPFEFTVGHCGLLHVVDFDGSFWVLSGDVDGDESAVLNGDDGTIVRTNRDVAEYTASDGTVFELARFPGAKRFGLCD